MHFHPYCWTGGQRPWIKYWVRFSGVVLLHALTNIRKQILDSHPPTIVSLVVQVSSELGTLYDVCLRVSFLGQYTTVT